MGMASACLDAGGRCSVLQFEIVLSDLEKPSGTGERELVHGFSHAEASRSVAVAGTALGPRCDRVVAGQMDVFVPRAMDPAVLDAVIRLNVTSALARTGESSATIDYGPGRPQSPGVTRWPVTYTNAGARQRNR